MPELTNSHVTMPGQTTNQASVPEQTKCRVGACKRFECRVIGYPRPSVRWFKDGKNITADGRYKFDYTADGCVVLVIENVTARDQGLYECRAENTEGAAETSAQLYVKGTHYETEPEEDVSVLSLSFRPVETSTPRSQRRPLVLADEELVTDPLNRNYIDESVDSNDLTTNGWPVDTLDISTIGDDTISDSGRQSGKEVKSDEDVAVSEHLDNVKESAEQNNQLFDQLGNVNVRREDLEQDRSSETSEDSVLGIESEIQGSTSDKGSDKDFDITADSNVDNNKAQLYDDVFTHDTEISNAQTNNDDALNCVASMSTSNDQVNDWEDARQLEVNESYNRNEELNNEIEDLVTMDKSGDPHSRRWATDSGVASRGSSLSSDTDFAIATDSMREMQAYLHGRKDAVYESFEHTSETAVEHNVATEMKTSMSSTSMSDAESGIEHFESESVDILSTESTSFMSIAQAETSQTEQLLSGELDLDGIRRRHNLADEQANDFTWESIEDSEQSVIAGKFLFARGPGTEEVKEMAHIYSEMETVQQHEETQMLTRESETCQTQSQKVETASSESQVLTMQSKSSKTELDLSETLEEHTTRIDNDVDFRTASEITEDTGADSFEKASGIKQYFKSAANGNVESKIEGKSKVDVFIDTSDIVGERVMTIDCHSDIINASAVTDETSAGSVNDKKTSHIIPTETTETTITGDVASLESSKMKHKLKETSIYSLPIANREGEIELNTASSEMSSDMQHETTIEHITSKDSDTAEMTSVDETDSTLKALDITVKTVTESESVLITHSQLMHAAQVEAVTGDQDAEINEQTTELKPISIAETPDTNTVDTSDKERVLVADSYEGELDTSIPSNDTFIDNDTDKPATSVDDIDVRSSSQGDAGMNGNTSMVDDIDEISNMRLAEHETSMVDSEMNVNTEISNTCISEIELGKSDELDMQNADKVIVDMTSADRNDLSKTEQEDSILTEKSLTEETNNESDTVDNKGEIEKELATSEAKSETKQEQPLSIESSTETKPSANVESAIGASEISIGMPELSAGIDMDTQIVPLETDIVADSMPISKVDEDKQESTHVDKVKESTPPDKPLDETDIKKTNANMENKSEEESKEAEIVGKVEIQKNIIPSETTQAKPPLYVDSTTETAGSPNVDTVISDLEIANSTSDHRARVDNDTEVAPPDLEIESMLTRSVNVADNREYIDKVTYQMDDNMKYDTRAKWPLESMKNEDADEDTTLSAQEAVHKTMHRDDAEKGKLDYEYADDAEARLAAGRYLFYCATPEVEEEDRKETAKELHYWKEAEAEEIKMQSLDETEWELPVKEITETTESSSDMNTHGKERLAAVTVEEALDDQVDKLEISAETGETICQDSIKASSDHVDQIEKRKLASANLDEADLALKEASVKPGDGAMEDYSSSERNTNEIMEQPEAIVKQESAYADEVKDDTSFAKPKDKDTCAKTETETKEEHVFSSKRIDETADEAVLIDKQVIASAIQLNDSKELDETTIKKMRVKAESESKIKSITNDRIEIEDNGMSKTEITNAGEPDSAEVEHKFKAPSNKPAETIDTIDGNELSKEPQTIEKEDHQIENKVTHTRDEIGSQEARNKVDNVSPAECKKMPTQKHEKEMETEMDDKKEHKHNDAVIDFISEQQKASNENETRQLEPQLDGASIEYTTIQTHERAREMETKMEDKEQDKHKETDIEISDQHNVPSQNEIQRKGASAESNAVEHWMDVGKSGAIEFKVNVTAVPADTHPDDLKDTERSESTSLTDSAATLEADTPVAVDHVSRPDDGIFSDKPQEVGLDIDDIKDSLKFTEVTSNLDTSEIDSVEAGFPEVLVVEGEPIHIEWNLHAISESEYHVYKDGFKIKRDDRLIVTYTSDACALDIASAALSDEATYSIRVDNRGEDLGCIDVLVNELEPGIDRNLSEPSFLVEPTVEIEGGRRLSIKCSVCGVPEPNVTWFIEGQQLGQGALWDTYSKDGFYHLALVDPSFLDCEEIVCRVENEAGFIQNVVKLKRDGYEISLEPVLPTAEVVTPVVLDAPPIVNLEITESKERYKKLKAYILPGDHCDKDNLVTFKQGEIVELLGTNLDGAILARNGRQKKKIGYLPSQMMLDKYGPADDVRAPESQTLAIRQTPERKQIGTTQECTQHTDTKEEHITMPERRKLTASSPGLHGTPRKKPKDRESPSELDRRLGFKENLTANKDTSQDHVRLTEYEDGTTRPMFKRRLRRIVADEGQLSQLECVISGTPQPKVLWLKNNRPLKASDGCQVVVDEESNILVFPKVSEDDAGVYTARAMNVNGSVMCTAELALSDGKAIDPGKEPTGTPMDLDFTTPAYFFQMSSCQVEEGRLARFDCRVVAYPKPEIVWMKDGKVVESEDRFKLLNFNNEIYSLLIQDVQHEDSGRYTCWARNKFGEAMTEAFLNVISLSAEDEQEGDQAPKFFTKFYDQQTTEGLEADFKCLIGGRPAPSLTWLLDDIELQDAPGVRLRRKDGMASLEVKSPTVDQSGQYTCHITNALGEATCSAHLTVIENKLRGKMLPKFLKKFDHVTVREGEEAVFTAVVVGEPKAKVTWMYNDKPLDASRRYVMKQDGDNYTLTVKNTRFDDIGKISCKAVNVEGEVYCYGNLLVRESRFMRDTPEKLPYKPESAKVDSKFGYIPTFTKRLQDTSVNEGGQARLECKVMGIPEPEVTWMKDGRVIPPVGRYHEMREGETCRLTIDNVRPEDQGVYTCIVSNNQGKSSSSAEVKMAGAGKKDTYTPDRTLADSYLKRPYGESPERFDALPKILAVPKMPYDRPTLLNKRDDSVRLAWLPAPTHDLPMDGRRLSYTIESKEIGGPRRDWKTVATDVPGNTYNVRNLRPDREYEFRVRAQNQYGPSEPTRPSTLEKRVDDVTTIGELPEVRAPPRLPTHRPIITDMGEETVRLAWRPVEPYKSKRTPPVSYRLEAKELPGRDWMPMSESLRDTTHYLSDLSRERDYMIRVRAENDFGVSEPTEPLWLPRATAFPGVPISRPEIVELEPQRARLSWSRVDIPAFGLDDAPLTYMLEAAEPPHDWRTIARDIDDTDYTVDGLKPGRDYRFRVRAKTPAGVVSEPSPAVSLYSTLAKSRAPVDRLEVLDLEPETRSAHLGWSRVEIPPYNAEDEPLMYMIEYNEPPVDDWRPLVTGVPTNQYRVMNLDPERDYNFRIRALTPYGVSPPSATLPVSLRHTPDTRRLSDAVIISDVDSDSLQLSWRRPMVDPSQDVSYQIQMLEQPLLDWRPVATGVTDTTYKVHGLRPKRDYQFRVIPHIGSRPLEPIPTVALSATAVRPRLHAAEPQLTELGPESVRLSWRPAEVPVYERKKPSIYYGVEKMELPSGSWVPAARRLTDTQHTLTGLRPDRDYRFRVTAETDTLTASEPSMAATMYRRPAPMFSRDVPVIRDLSPNVVTMSWHPAAIPAGLARPPNVTYNVEVQSPPGMSAWTTLYAAHATPSARLADLRPDKDYLVRVRAQYDDHVTEPTLPVYIPRRAVPPRMPVEEPYVVDVQPESVKLQWRSADLPMHIMDYSPISYRIEGRELPGGQWVNVARGVPHTDFTITGLTPDKDYEFRVKAENNYGLSDTTRPITLTKRAVAPVLAHDEPLIYDLGPGSARLSWRPATMPSHLPRTSPTTYTIQVQDAPSKTWRPYIKRIPHTSYYVSGLDATKDYNFRVVADNDFGSSRPTQPVYMPKYADLHVKRPISMPEVDEFDDDLTSVKLHWKPRAGSPFDSYQGGYQIESWEPVKRKWRSVAKGIPGTSYHLRDLPAVPDHLFRVRMETDHASLSEPSLPVSVSRYLGHPRMPIHRPQLYEVDLDSAMLSWQPVHVQSRRPVRYSVEQREIPEPKWRHVGNDILDTNYRLRSLRPKSDYEFRVRALIDGESSEPSFPVPLYRKAAIPRVQLDTPEVHDVVDDALTLRWNKVDVPAFSADDEPLTFIVERQQLPSYEWEPVATDITDSTYRVKDLQPYQDYSFRIRGLYPSGYTEPSPAVPVYRRPSESRLQLASSSYSYSVLNNLQSANQKSSIRKRPTHIRRSRRCSLPQIYDIKNSISDLREASFKSASPVYVPKFKMEDAYVYNRKEIKRTHPPKLSQEYNPQTKNDVKPRMSRRHSDVGIDLSEWYARRPRIERHGYVDKQLEERVNIARYSLATETHVRSTSLPKHVPVLEYEPHEYRSVADRYEGIKCPYIMRPHILFPHRRSSISLDPQDFADLRKTGKTQFHSKARSRSTSPEITGHMTGYGTRSYAHDSFYFMDDGMHVKRRGLPRVSRNDMGSRTSHEQEYGYFAVSKFSLMVSGVRRPLMPSYPSEVSSRSSVSRSPLRHTALPSFRSRSLTPDVDKYESTPRSRSLSQSLSQWKELSKSVDATLSKVKEERSRSAHAPSISITSVTSRTKRDRKDASPRRQRPRSNSISTDVPLLYRSSVSESTAPKDCKFPAFKLIEDSRTLQTKVEQFSKPKETHRVVERRSSVTSEARFVSKIAITPTVKPAKPQIHHDVKSDPRFSIRRRHSLADPTGDLLKHRLDSLKHSLLEPKALRGSGKREDMFGLSRRSDITHTLRTSRAASGSPRVEYPRSDKLAYIARRLQA